MLYQQPQQRLSMQKYHYSSKLILISGFAFVIAIMSALTVTWAIHVFESKENIKVIFGEQKQSRLLVAMRDAARKRAIYLHRMAVMKDVFDRDAEYMKFNEAATDFVVARDELLSMEKEASREVLIWNKARPHIINGQTVQLETAELILQDRVNDANELLLDKVIPIQNQVNETLSAMFGVQKDTALNAYESAIERNENIYWIAVVSGSSAVLLTIFIAIVVIRRTAHAEASLDEARVAAQTATEMKSQFLANMSHEIRTPLTAVIGYADTLLTPGVNEQEREYSATRILNNGNHLLHIINDILDISKIEAGQLSIEKLEVSPTQLLMNVDSLIGGSIRDKGLDFRIHYDFPLPEKIQSDPTRLKQILLNLLGNAKKFTESGRIELFVNYLGETRQMRFEVVDTGIGMSAEEQARLFTPFTQGDTTTTRKFGGSGLGLYISRQLAQMLGGDLNCRSVKGQGSRFIATINTGVTDDTRFIDSLDAAPVKKAQSQRDVTPSLNGKVLLAEDNPDNQRLISLYIKRTGAHVVVVNNGQEAVEQAVGGDFDLIIMDMQMPVMGGAEAIQWLRNVGNQTSIAMLTANAMKEEKERCINLGASEFLTKPLDKQAFYTVLSRYLQPRVSEGDTSETVTDKFDDDLRRLTSDFIASLATYSADLQRSLEAGDWQKMQSIVHQLKGMGGSFGFPRITDLCETADEELKNDNLEQAINVVTELLDYCDQLGEDRDNSNLECSLGS
jgi:signal transduction histidine kinase/FixJ family two-component response regulator